MAQFFERPITCPTLIGRTAHLEALDLAIQETAAGRGQILLISGEAGIGKSRLVAEAQARCIQAGCTVLQGHCFEPDRALPYAPLRDLLRDLVSQPVLEEILQAMGPAAASLLDLLPASHRIAIDLPAASPLGPAEEKRRRVEGLVELFTRLAAVRPLAILIEDLHWSDEATLEALHHLARRTPGEPIGLWLTYRSDEAPPALARFLAGLDRERTAVELKLAGLTVVQVGDMLRATFGSERLLRHDFVTSLHELTEGNPFFVEEVLNSLVAGGDLAYADGHWEGKPSRELQIPRTVRQAVQSRTAQLSPMAQRVVVLAAVTGRRFDFALLQELTGCDEAQLLNAVKELIAAQLVVELSADQLAFRHALTREAIVADLLARERRALHRTIVQTLERITAPAPETQIPSTSGTAGSGQILGDLAYHSYEAGLWQPALDYCARMGERAQALSAPGAAVEQLTRALYAGGQLGLDPLPARLLAMRGLAYETLGEFELARSDLEAAVLSARAAGDHAAEWQALLNLGALWASRDYEQSGAYFRQVLDLAHDLEDPPALARSLNRLGNWLANLERPAEALQHHQQALTIFEALCDQVGIAETSDLLGLTSLLLGNPIEATGYWKRAITRFRDLDLRQALASTLMMSSTRGAYGAVDVLEPTDPLEDCLRDAEEGLAIARDIGWRAGEAYGLRVLAFSLGPWGEYGRALNCAAESMRIAEDIGHIQWQVASCCTMGQLYLELLAPGTAEPFLSKAAALVGQTGSRIWSSTASALLAEVYIQQNQLPEAAALLDQVFDRKATTISYGQRAVWRARIKYAIAKRVPALALELIDQLVASTPTVNQRPELAIPLLAHLRGEALAAQQRPVEAREALLAAREGTVRQGARGQLWRIDLALGRIYRAEGRREDAEYAFQAARTLIEELATNVPPGPLRENFLARAVALLPRVQPLSPRRAAQQAFGGLTTREREVAARIAQGMSNRAIADDLVISERTVETHTANILAKLGISARTQIAAWAVEHGLGKVESSGLS